MVHSKRELLKSMWMVWLLWVALKSTNSAILEVTQPKKEVMLLEVTNYSTWVDLIQSAIQQHEIQSQVMFTLLAALVPITCKE